jgi:hypothetical protein
LKDPIKGGVIEDPRIVELAGRRFVVGELVTRSGSPTAREGCTYWFPIDDVLGLIEYPDRARVNELAKECDRRDEKPGKQ